MADPKPLGHRCIQASQCTSIDGCRLAGFCLLAGRDAGPEFKRPLAPDLVVTARITASGGIGTVGSPPDLEARARAIHETPGGCPVCVLGSIPNKPSWRELFEESRERHRAAARNVQAGPAGTPCSCMFCGGQHCAECPTCLDATSACPLRLAFARAADVIEALASGRPAPAAPVLSQPEVETRVTVDMLTLDGLADALELFPDDTPPVEHPAPWRWEVGGTWLILRDANGAALLCALENTSPFTTIVLALLEAAPEMRAALDKIIEVAEGMTALAANDRQVHPDDFAEEWAAVKEVRELLARIDARSKGASR